MRFMSRKLLAVAFAAGSIAIAGAQQARTPPQGQGTIITLQQPAQQDTVRTLVGRLDLEKYKATIKGLTQFGDRREGTERNRKAVDWIEAQLKSYGCETVRMSYDPNRPRPGGGGRGQGGRGRGAGRGTQPPRTPAGTPEDPVRRGAGGKGYGARTGVNNDPQRQQNEELRALNMGEVIPGNVDQVYCTRVGATRPGEMYIIGGHMDGIGYGEAANDDGSGTAIVMELARVFSAPDVTTDVSIRFALWNGEEGGLKGARAYVEQRQALQGKDEPTWLGMIQHDMMMFDHGMPRPDGTLSPQQRPEADVNIEFQENSKMAAESQKLAWLLKSANERYATDYPATVGSHMQSTDSVPFQDIVPAISLRENERRDHIGVGWDPHWHQPTDVFSTFSDQDFRLGLNAAQTTLAAVAQLAGANVKGETGFTPLFNGKDLSGWIYGRRGNGAENRSGKGYQVENGVIFSTKEDGGNLYTEKAYGDFAFRFEFRLTENANNGIGIRAPLQGDAAYAGIEIQVLDDSGSQYATLRPAQYHGSIYDVVPAKRGFQKPVGEWNSEEIIARGRRITVILNGTTIVDADLSDIKDTAAIDKHPGLANAKGHIGFLGHGTRVEFRNIRIKEL
jgi:Domain of Unknown Function (DUF1080)/Peptidase family M28